MAASFARSGKEIRSLPLGGSYVPSAPRILDLDGLPDLAVADAGTWDGQKYVGSAMRLFFNQGGGRFKERRILEVGSGPGGIVAADLDRDGLPDLIVPGRNDLSVSLIHNRGNGDFSPWSTTYVTSSYLAGDLSVAAIDLDQDGFRDLAVGDANTGDLTFLRSRAVPPRSRDHHRYDSIPGRERGAVPGAIPNGFVRDVGGHDRPGFDLSLGGRSHPSYRTSEPWLVHDVFFLLAVTELHLALR